MQENWQPFENAAEAIQAGVELFRLAGKWAPAKLVNLLDEHMQRLAGLPLEDLAVLIEHYHVRAEPARWLATTPPGNMRVLMALRLRFEQLLFPKGLPT